MSVSKYIWSYIFLFFTAFCSGQDHQGSIYYSNYFKIDSSFYETAEFLALSKKDKNLEYKLDQMLLDIPPKDFILDYNANKAFYYWNENQKTPLSGRRKQNVMRQKFFFLKNKESIYRFEEVSGIKKNIAKKFEDFEWQIVDEYKEIMGYNCQKAISIEIDRGRRGNSYIEIPTIAWFTNEIPLPYGPNGFGGLPGLILEIKIGRSNYFTAIKTKHQKTEINIPDNFDKSMSEGEYIKFFENNRK